MDTRLKLISLEEAVRLAAQRPVRVVTGYFDPLLAAHAARVEEIRAAAAGEALLAVVLDPAAPILPARARAELVAALAAIDYVVVLPQPDAEQFLARIPAAGIVREEEADRLRTQALIEHVQQRHVR
jgi:bifunctional ADP-heptose synthase (sugar kinase/adenylyltransferase)